LRNFTDKCNHAISKAQGTYILLLDADNRISPESSRESRIKEG